MNQAYNHLIGTRIRSVRMQQKLSQEQLAAKAQLLGGDTMEMGSRYLDALHTFFGIGKYTCIAADGMNVAGFDAEASLRRAMQEAAQLAASL